MSTVSSLENDFRAALTRLDEVLEQEKTPEIRDAAILRFEIAHELAWKLIKAVLYHEHGIECRSPKSCIREAHQQGLIEYDEYWLEIVNKRNELSHIYKESVAEDVYRELPQIREKFEELSRNIASLF